MSNFRHIGKKLSLQKILVFTLCALLLTACTDRVDVNKLCKENPGICEELTPDSWCKAERVSIIAFRVNVKNANKDIDKYNLLLAYEDYAKCMGIASQIEHIKLKEKGTYRKNNLIKAKEQLAYFTKDTLKSEHPHLLFYHWTRRADQEALDKFLKLEGTAALENSRAQFDLATYYIKRDHKKTFGLLYRSLELYDPDSEFPTEIIQTLATMHYKQKQYKQAYIWLKTYELILDKPDKLVNESLLQYEKAFDLDVNFLNKVASNNLDKIEDGEFKSPKY